MKFKPEASEKEQIKEKLKEIKLKAAEDKEIARTYIYKNKERNKMKIELGIKRHAKGPNPLSCKKKIKIENDMGGEPQKKIRRKRKNKSVEPSASFSND